MAKLRVGVTAARKGAELSTAFERRGAHVLHGPTLGGDRPAPDTAIVGDLDRLVASSPRWFAASTGMGMRLLREVAERTGRRDVLVDMLVQATVLARGAKATGGLRGLDISPSWVAPDELDSQVAERLATQASPTEPIAVQLHGAGRHPYDMLNTPGRALNTVSPYVSTLPADPQPGLRLITAIVSGQLDVVTFTSPGAVYGLRTLAETHNLAHQVRAALSAPVEVAVIGPVTREAAKHAGYAPTIEPTTHRNGALLTAIMGR